MNINIYSVWYFAAKWMVQMQGRWSGWLREINSNTEFVENQNLRNGTVVHGKSKRTQTQCWWPGYKFWVYAQLWFL